AEIDRLAVLERARRADRGVVEPDIAADAALHRRRVGRGAEPFVDRAGLVRLGVAVADPFEAIDRHYFGERGRALRETLAVAAMEHQRFVGIDDELAKGETLGAARGRGESGEAINAAADFVDARFHIGHLKKE